MAKVSNITVSVSMTAKTIRFYASNPQSTALDIQNSVSFTPKQFDEAFFNAFTEALTDFVTVNSLQSPIFVTLILPDNTVFSDTLTILNIGRSATKASLNSTMQGLYKNFNELKLDVNPVFQSKQHHIYCVSGIRKPLLNAFAEACSHAKCVLKNTTFTASATVSGISHLNSKLKNASYLFMDIQDTETCFILVYKGKSVSNITLPFGKTVLTSSKQFEEDMLFNHSVAELAVLNAREKARMKSLTMMGNSVNSENAFDGDFEDDGDEFSAFPENPSGVDSTVKTLPRKTVRKLPKSLQRPIPTTPEELCYENFRFFVKWALCYLQGNKNYTQFAKAEAVYVNLPDSLQYLYDMVNQETSENGILFLSPNLPEDEETRRTLDIFGASLTKNNNSVIYF